MELLRHANHIDNVNCADGNVLSYESRAYQRQVSELRDLYEAILAAGEAQNPVPELAPARPA